MSDDVASPAPEGRSEPVKKISLRRLALRGVVWTLAGDGGSQVLRFISNLILTRLLRIVETVSRGDPFVAVNAYRLQAIAWLLLALQVLSIIIGGIGKAIASKEFPLHLDAGFSTSGWLAVILTFVLARVFAEGTLMREDLEGTV